jgi:hypothetical protein
MAAKLKLNEKGDKKANILRVLVRCFPGILLTRLLSVVSHDREETLFRKQINQTNFCSSFCGNFPASLANSAGKNGSHDESGDCHRGSSKAR